MSEPGCWRDPPCPYGHTCTPPLADLHPAQRGKQDETAGAVCVSVSVLSVICVSGHVHIHGVYVCPACMYWEYVLSLNIDLGCGSLASFRLLDSV